MPHVSMAIANEFLRKPGALGNLTQMQLLKLAYIAHGWNLAVNGEALLSEPVRAWDYGPVVPELYDHIKFYGTSPIGRQITDADSEAARFFGKKKPEDGSAYQEHLTPAEHDVINRVWNRYGSYSGFKLSALTHKPGTPWFQTYFGEGKNSIIPNDRIRAHYVELAHSVV
jgi:uncharacterized phage-associated protein